MFIRGFISDRALRCNSKILSELAGNLKIVRIKRNIIIVFDSIVTNLASLKINHLRPIKIIIVISIKLKVSLLRINLRNLVNGCKCQSEGSLGRKRVDKALILKRIKKLLLRLENISLLHLHLNIFFRLRHSWINCFLRRTLLNGVIKNWRLLNLKSVLLLLELLLFL